MVYLWGSFVIVIAVQNKKIQIKWFVCTTNWLQDHGWKQISK